MMETDHALAIALNCSRHHTGCFWQKLKCELHQLAQPHVNRGKSEPYGKTLAADLACEQWCISCCFQVSC